MPSKKLYLFRHGKSDWKSRFNNDHERTLAERGVEAAKAMGIHLDKIGQVPEVIISSSAKRAVDTVSLANEFGQWGCDIIATRELYLASVEEAMELIQKLKANAKRVMLVTHEPLCSNLVSDFAMGAHIKFPTASIARVDFKVDSWVDIESDKGQLAWLLTPKTLFGSSDK